MESLNPFDMLHYEMKILIFRFLPFKEAVHCNRVCKEWKTLFEDESIWNIFKEKVSQIFDKNEAKISREVLFEKISEMVNFAKENDPKSKYRNCLAHIFLTRLGLSTLDNAQKLAEIKCDKKNRMLWQLSDEYLRQNQVDKAEEMLEKMSKKPRRMAEKEARIVAPYDIFNRYLKMGDFDKALSMTKYFKIEKGHSQKALSLLIWNAGQQFKNEIAVHVLAKYEDKNNAWGSCVRDLHATLSDRKCFEVADVLKSIFPKAFIKEENHQIHDMLHFMHTHRIEKAENVILSIENDEFSNYIKVYFLKKIKNAYREEGKEEDVLRLKEIIGQEIKRIGSDPTKVIGL